MTVPADIVSRLVHFHDNPFVWFSGQLLSYLMRFNSDFEKIIKVKREKHGFRTPCVGLDKRNDIQYLIN
jgi:hypothetical protein